MNDSIKRISLDIQKASSGEAVNIKIGDTGRTIHISLVDGGVPYIISEDCYAVFTAKKPDGNVVYNDCTIENNTIIYEVTEQTVAVEGRVNCEIKLYGADDKLITSSKFTIIVHGTVYNEGDEIESSDEFSALTKMVGAAQQATKEANEAAQNSAHTAKSLMVVGKAEGTAISLDDAIKQYLVGCRIFGKTTQNEVPTPDVPADLVSSVEGESLCLFVTGKNLFTGWIEGGIASGDGADFEGDTKRRTDYLPISSPVQKILISGIPSTLYNMAAFYDADKVYISRSTATGSSQRVYDVPAKAKYFRIAIYESSATTGVIAEAEAMANITMIETGETVTAYEPAKPIQKATITTPNGLHGIPVTAGGNYTDASGQQWICDEIDFARGVYVHRVGMMVLDGTEGWSDKPIELPDVYYIRIPDMANHTNAPAICSHFPFSLSSLRDGTLRTILGSLYFMHTSVGNDLSAWKGYLAEQYEQGHPIKVAYSLADTVETPLSEEELASYEALHTHREQTQISNDGHACLW